MSEIWRQIPEWPYEVSSLGRVRRGECLQRTYAGRVLRLTIGRNGYVYVMLSNGGRRARFTVHRLVALAFLGPRPVGMQVNHRDGNKQNNVIANLEYVSGDENMHHAVVSGLIKRGEQIHLAKLTEDAVRAIRRRYVPGVTRQVDLAHEFGVAQTKISAVIRGETWKHVN